MYVQFDMAGPRMVGGGGGGDERGWDYAEDNNREAGGQIHCLEYDKQDPTL